MNKEIRQLAARQLAENSEALAKYLANAARGKTGKTKKRTRIPRKKEYLLKKSIRKKKLHGKKKTKKKTAVKKPKKPKKPKARGPKTWVNM